MWNGTDPTGMHLLPGATLADAGYADNAFGGTNNAQVNQDTAGVQYDTQTANQVTPGQEGTQVNQNLFQTPRVPTRPAQGNDNTQQPPAQAGGNYEQAATPEQQPASNEENAVEVALRGAMLSRSDEDIIQDFMWQGEHGSARAAELRNQMLSFKQEIEAYGMVFKGSNKIKVLHGITQYHGRQAPELNGAILGRMGKWNLFSTPQLLQLQPEKSFKWVKVKLPKDPTVIRDFLRDENNKGKLYRLGDDVEVEETEVPMLVALPPPGGLVRSSKRKNVRRDGRVLGKNVHR